MFFGSSSNFQFLLSKVLVISSRRKCAVSFLVEIVRSKHFGYRYMSRG